MKSAVANARTASADDFFYGGNMALNYLAFAAAGPAFLVFGLLGWTAVFIETYRHFPHMGRKERLKTSIINATSLTLIVLAVIAVFAYFIFRGLS